MVAPSLIVISLLSSIVITNAQCATPNYIPCLPNGGQLDGLPPGSLDNTLFWANLQSIADGAILRRRNLAHHLATRQNSLCCSPNQDVQCLVTTNENIPFCYNQQTTQFLFPDQSFGFIDNGSYYAPDGTFVNFDTGYYSSTDGTEGTFAPATAAVSATKVPFATSTEMESLSSMATGTRAASARSATNSEAAATTATQRSNLNATQTPVAAQSTNGAVGTRGVAAMKLFLGFCGLFILL